MTLLLRMCLFNHTIRPPLFSTYFTWSEVHWEPYNDDDDYNDRYDDVVDDYGDYDENDNDVCSDDDDDDDCYDDYVLQSTYNTVPVLQNEYIFHCNF